MNSSEDRNGDAVVAPAGGRTKRVTKKDGDAVVAPAGGKTKRVTKKDRSGDASVLPTGGGTKRVAKPEMGTKTLEAKIKSLATKLKASKGKVTTLEAKMTALQAQPAARKAEKRVLRLQKEREELEGYLDEMTRYAFALRALSSKLLKKDRAYGPGGETLERSRKWWRRIALTALLAALMMSYGRFPVVESVIDWVVKTGKGLLE